MTFDYSIESQSSKMRLNKVAQAMLGKFDPLSTKSIKKSKNYVSKKVGMTSVFSKKKTTTPKSQSPHNEIQKPRKVSTKWFKSKPLYSK